MKDNFTIKTITSYEEFRAHKDAWEDLCSRSGAKNIFVTYDWIDAYIKHIKKNEKLLIMNILKGDRLEAIAPLMIKKDNYLGLPSRVVSFLGRPVSDRMDFIANGHKEEAVKFILDHLVSIKSDWDIIELREIAEDTGTMKIIERWMRANGFSGINGPSARSFFIRFGKDKEKIVRVFSEKFKRKIGKLNSKAVRSKLDFRNYTDSDARKMFNDMEAIEKQSWKGIGRTGIFSKGDTRNFHRELSDRFSGKDKGIDVSILSFDKNPIAYIYSYYYEKRLHVYSVAFDKRYSRLSPGSMLMFWRLANASDIDFSELDLLRGDEAWKSEIAQSFRTHNSVKIFKKSAYPMFLYNLQARVVPCVKKVLGR
jgi:CelD/BcsL family acetyltransferase involved in cellulose biosynthesis